MAGRKWAELLLGILLIFVGMVAVLKLTFQSMDVILGVMAIVDGVLWLIGK